MTMRAPTISGAVWAAVALFGAPTSGQDAPAAAPQTDGAPGVFCDKPEFIVLPSKDATAAVECAVYAPRPAAPGTRAGLVVHLYGHGGTCRNFNMMRAPYATVRRLLWERGYWLVVPGLGGSHWMNDKAARSLDAVIAGMIQDHGVDPARVTILGTSMGGGSSLVYAMRHPGRVRSVCAVFPMTDYSKWVQEAPRYLPAIAKAHGVEPADAGPVLQNLSPLSHAAAFAGMSVFLLHGDADGTVPVHHSREFAAALQAQGSPVIYREARGGKHKDAIAEPYQQEIADFLTGMTNQAVSGASQP